MQKRQVVIDARKIRDWRTFHDLFQQALGFPISYGRNMNAWVDCMTYLDADNGMSQITLAEGEELTLRVKGAGSFQLRCPEQYRALMDSVAFVNERRAGLRPILNLEFER